MILDYHPCFNLEDYPPHLRDVVKQTPFYIGFWKGRLDPDLPDPKDYVDPVFDLGVMADVLEYLDLAPFTNEYRGFSRCRFCGIENGYREKSDGRYTWPEGFAHYVADHSVRPPHDFLVRVMNRAFARKGYPY